jgi:dihydrofolate synthase/folylpolyglutamate synthase
LTLVLPNRTLSEEVFNLDRMRHFMLVLGDPQNAYKTVHVAGTKGKGSISAMLASALNHAAIKLDSTPPRI